ncbi:RNA-binding protein 41 isoform X3 [Acanthochromis polyacanthus]|uniref:RNA-binding protein 41 isoform X3 n=1 Tax=Acanthochromis polyacanthus TaxID=80966 RepID=UPI002234E256|nr:RNA-binding protein 41 isoform X3 [Acanthochromis polyacanthus]
MRRVSRRPCEDGPLLEEQETEGQRQLHSLLLQQLHTDVDIDRCVAKRQCFAPAALYRPFGEQAAGVRSLSQFQALQDGEKELASLRELGLTDAEIQLWQSRDVPEATEKPNGVCAAPGAKQQRLQVIRDKIEARAELLSRPQRFAASRPMSRREMEIEQALFQGNDRLGFLTALYHRDEENQESQQGASSSDPMDSLYRDVLRSEKRASLQNSEGESPAASHLDTHRTASNQSQDSQRHSNQSQDSQRHSNQSQGSQRHSDQSQDSQRHSNQSQGSQRHSNQSQGSQRHSNQSQGSQRHSNQSQGSQRHSNQSQGSQRHSNQSQGSQRHSNQSQDSQRHSNQSQGSQRHSNQSQGSQRHSNQSQGSQRHSNQSQGSQRHSNQSQGSQRHSDQSQDSQRHSDQSQDSQRHSDQSQDSQRHSDQSQDSQRHSDQSQDSQRHSNQSQDSQRHSNQSQGLQRHSDQSKDNSDHQSEPQDGRSSSSVQSGSEDSEQQDSEDRPEPRPAAAAHINMSHLIGRLTGPATPGRPLTVRGDIQTITDEEILKNRESEEEIRNIPRFRSYQRGKPSKVLCVKNLSAQASVAQLVALFSRFERQNGPPVVYRLLTGRMKGQAFITLPDAETAQNALQLVHGYRLLGKPLVVEFGRERQEEEKQKEKEVHEEKK